MDSGKYQDKQKEQLERYEAMCARCGECCGAYDGDPCSSLDKAVDGKYYCRDYANRGGTQKTISGRSFSCVPIRELINFEVPYSRCPYLTKGGKEIA